MREESKLIRIKWRVKFLPVYNLYIQSVVYCSLQAITDKNYNNQEVLLEINTSLFQQKFSEAFRYVLVDHQMQLMYKKKRFLRMICVYCNSKMMNGKKLIVVLDMKIRKILVLLKNSFVAYFIFYSLTGYYLIFEYFRVDSSDIHF